MDDLALKTFHVVLLNLFEIGTEPNQVNVTEKMILMLNRINKETSKNRHPRSSALDSEMCTD